MQNVFFGLRVFATQSLGKIENVAAPGEQILRLASERAARIGVSIDKIAWTVSALTQAPRSAGKVPSAAFYLIRLLLAATLEVDG